MGDDEVSSEIQAQMEAAERTWGVTPEDRKRGEAIRDQLRAWREKNPLTDYPHPMAPPWSVFPDSPRVSLHWRMGSGEDHMIAFRRWYESLADEQRREFTNANPEPAGWAGFYEMLNSAQQ